jgi:uncharacterized protein
MPTKIFVSLPVKDLAKSKAFFGKLGYTFNPQFTDDTTACLVISDDIYAMLITEGSFARFTKKKIADAREVTEAIIALSAESREKVDAFTRTAVAAGGKVHRDPEEHGWMYGQSIEDLDGHIWEMFWMDPSKIEKTK